MITAMPKQMIPVKTIGLYLSVILAVIFAGCNSTDKTSGPATQQYRCPMHHEIIRDKPGTCPICGMDLVPFGGGEKAITDVNLNTLLKPTNSYVLTAIPVVSVQQAREQIEVQALGTVQYDTRDIGTVSSRVSGRIEKLYLKYTFQDVSKGQKIMDIYSPELLTAQQNLLFLIRNDADNTSLINAAKEKLLLLGMSNGQLGQVIQSQKPSFSVPVYSNYNGHIHDALSMNTGMTASLSAPVTTRDLMLKEGMYVQKGQTLLSVYNPHKLWVVLNIYAENQALVRVGNAVRVIPETVPTKDFRGMIDFIEPFYRKESKTLTARVYFDNSNLNIPIGSQVRATIFGNTRDAYWLPKEAVLSSGIDKVVFQKADGGFKAHKIYTGVTHKNHVQVLSGMKETDSVAVNAQYLMDSESFIKIKN